LEGGRLDRDDKIRTGKVMKKPVIVCIDDEPDVLHSLKIELKKAIGDQCIIETAEGGEDALELLADLQADEYEIA